MISLLLKLVSIILTVIEYEICYILVFGEKICIKKDRVIFLPVSLMSIILLLYEPIYWICLLSASLISIILSLYLFRIRFLDSLKIFVILLPFLSILGTIIENVLEYDGLKEDMIREIVSIIISLIFIFIYFLITRKNIGRNISNLKKSELWIVSVLLWLIEVMISYFAYVLNNIFDEDRNIGLILMTIGGSSVMAFAFVLLHYFSVNRQNAVRSEILELNMLQQRDYYERLLNKEIETRRFRHDIIDELLVIKGMLDDSDVGSASNMISEMLDNINSVNVKGYESGNSVINTILNYYLNPVKDICDIKVSGNVSEEIDITDVDLCIVVSNVIKNAVDAIKTVDKGNGYISITFGNGRHFVSMSVENSYVNSKKTISDENDKVRAHGYGRENIKRIVEKNGGMFEEKVSNNSYVSSIKLVKL